MRFERIQIHAFGTLRELDTGPEPLPRLVVVEGPNEAGKSTFFQLLTSLLYGFYPASRDGNPFTPWNGGDASAEATLLLDGGERWQVHRRLLSTPTGSLVRGETTEELRNRTLSCAEHVPSDIFQEVFALTLRELAALKGDGWSRVQDRLISGMGSADLLPPREVAEQLEKEAGRLWRPNHRGTQEVRDLRERIRDLKLRRRNAAEEDRKLREKDRELEQIRQALREAREEREACRIYIDRYADLLPVRNQLRRIDELEMAAGPNEALAGLPADPGHRLEELGREMRRLASRREELEQAERAAREAAGRFDGSRRRMVEHRDRIRASVGRASAVQAERVRGGQVAQEVRELRRRIDALAAEFLGRDPEKVDLQALRTLAPGPLQEAADEVRQAAEAVRLAVDAAPPEGTERDAGPEVLQGRARIAGFVLLGGGTTLGWMGATGGSGATLVLGAVLLGLGALLLGLAMGAGRRERREQERAAERARKRVEEARRREKAARDALTELLGSVPIRQEVLDRPGGDLGARVQRLQELIRDREDREEEAAALEARLREVEGEMRDVGQRVGVELPDEPAAAAHVLEEALREAERLRDRCRSAEEEADRVRKELDGLLEAAADVDAEQKALEERIAALGGGDAAAGLQAVRERIEARERARQLRAELERNHADLPSLQAQIREAEAKGRDWIVDDDALARRKARAEELNHRVEELVSRAKGLERDLAHGREQTPVADVEGELDLLRGRLEAAVRKADRLRVLAALIRQADRTFREEHQPDILRRAGAHLGAITGGRYERVLVSEAGSAPSFQLRAPGYPGPVEVSEPVSTGTREQVYLALRLAILDHLDRGGERLPLFIDEAFVNWDRERRDRGLALLDAATGERQVFVFTCHPAIAETLVERGARRLTLPAPA